MFQTTSQNFLNKFLNTRTFKFESNPASGTYSQFSKVRGPRCKSPLCFLFLLPRSHSGACTPTPGSDHRHDADRPRQVKTILGRCSLSRVLPLLGLSSAPPRPLRSQFSPPRRRPQINAAPSLPSTAASPEAQNEFAVRPLSSSKTISPSPLSSRSESEFFNLTSLIAIFFTDIDSTLTGERRRVHLVMPAS